MTENETPEQNETSEQNEVSEKETIPETAPTAVEATANPDVPVKTVPIKTAKASKKAAPTKSAAKKASTAPKKSKTASASRTAAKKKPGQAKASAASSTANAASSTANAAPSKTSAASSKAKAAKKAKGETKSKLKATTSETATILESQVAFEGPLFRVMRDHIIEPGGRESHRDVIRHNGSVVILAVDPGKRKKDPWVVIERQYRHAAGQFLWELPAGKLDAGEAAIDGAKRELTEETGYQARKWSPLVEYYASPGFLGESMKVFLAEGLVAGDAHPEEDEHIDFRLVKLSELLEMVDKGRISDGKTLSTVLLYARKLGLKRRK